MMQRIYYKFYLSDGERYCIFCKVGEETYFYHDKFATFLKARYWRDDWNEELVAIDSMQIMLMGYDDYPLEEEDEKK